MRLSVGTLVELEAAEAHLRYMSGLESPDSEMLIGRLEDVFGVLSRSVPDLCQAEASGGYFLSRWTDIDDRDRRYTLRVFPDASVGIDYGHEWTPGNIDDFSYVYTRKDGCLLTPLHQSYWGIWQWGEYRGDPQGGLKGFTDQVTRALEKVLRDAGWVRQQFTLPESFLISGERFLDRAEWYPKSPHRLVRLRIKDRIYYPPNLVATVDLVSRSLRYPFPDQDIQRLLEERAPRLFDILHRNCRWS